MRITFTPESLVHDGDHCPRYWQPVNPGAKWKPRHGIDDFVKETFTAGECGSLALVLHDLTGWPLYLEADYIEPSGYVPETYIAHVWVTAPKNHAVDILGVRKRNYCRTAYTTHVGKVIPATATRMRSIFRRPHFHAWAKRIVTAFPEHFGL